MARGDDKLADALGSLLGISDRQPERGRGCWPDKPDDGKSLRRCWPEPADLPRGDQSPADAIRKILRGRWL